MIAAPADNVIGGTDRLAETTISIASSKELAPPDHCVMRLPLRSVYSRRYVPPGTDIVNDADRVQVPPAHSRCPDAALLRNALTQISAFPDGRETFPVNENPRSPWAAMFEIELPAT